MTTAAPTLALPSQGENYDRLAAIEARYGDGNELDRRVDVAPGDD